MPAKRKRSQTLSQSKVRKIVREMNEKTREKKFKQISQSDFPIQTTGTNFTIDPSSLSQGLTVNTRIGNEVNWTSWYMKMILKTGYNTAYPHMVRLIWYTPRVDGDVIPTTTSVVGFIDMEKFIVHSDKIVKIGSSMQRDNHTDPPTGVDAFKVLHFGKKFKKPVKLLFDSVSPGSLITPTRRLYMVSTNSSGAASYSTLCDLRATMYFTDP